MKKNLVSIIIPFFNDESYISETLKTVFEQTYKNWELILINDNSTDNSVNKIKNFIRDNRVKLINNKYNMGPARSRNIGLKQIKGEYICFLDSDDLWHPKKIEKQLNFMIKNKLQFTCTNYTPFRNLEKKLNTIKPKKKISFNDLVHDTSIATSTMMIKRTIQKNLIFNKNFYFDDYVFKLDLLQKTYCHNINFNLMSYRIKNNSVSSNKFRNFLEVLKVNRKYNKFSLYKSFYTTFNVCINSLKRYGYK